MIETKETFDIQKQSLQILIEKLAKKEITEQAFLSQAFKHYHNLSEVVYQLFDDLLKIIKFTSVYQNIEEDLFEELEKIGLIKLLLLNAKNYDELEKEISMYEIETIENEPVSRLIQNS